MGCLGVWGGLRVGLVRAVGPRLRGDDGRVGLSMILGGRVGVWDGDEFTSSDLLCSPGRGSPPPRG